ncbi:MAG: EutN/CcmL family microcompartment protein [Anaerolineales bacterium]|nr:EutN/CcmL family microcompartment protein [Anaerolineales bacterium]
MRIAKVVGVTVSTIKQEKLHGRTLLVVRETDESGEVTGKPLVAVDVVEAGVGDLVLIAQGSAARQTDVTDRSPVDAVIMAVIDSLQVDGEVTFRKS